MFKQYLFFIVFWYANMLSAAFEVKELNVHDASEVDGVYALFDDPENSKQTAVDSDDIRRMVRLQKGKIFISKTQAIPAVVTGVLVCEYIQQAFNCVPDCQTVLAWDRFLSGKYEITEYDAARYQVIAVHPHYRRQGIACALLKKADQFCIQQGVDKVDIGVFKSNQKAIDCYIKHGFEEYMNKAYSDILWLYKNLKSPKKSLVFDQAELLSLLAVFHE